MTTEGKKEFARREAEARRKVFGKPVNWKHIRRGYTEIVDARTMFDPGLERALRKLGLQAKIQRARVWIEGEEAHFFDLALQKSFVRFRAFARDVLARANGPARLGTRRAAATGK